MLYTRHAYHTAAIKRAGCRKVERSATHWFLCYGAGSFSQNDKAEWAAGPVLSLCLARSPKHGEGRGRESPALWVNIQGRWADTIPGLPTRAHHRHRARLKYHQIQETSSFFADNATYTGTQMLPFWQNLHHWLHRKLSFWQFSVQSVMKILSKWHFRFRIEQLRKVIGHLQALWLLGTGVWRVNKYMPEGMAGL